MKRSFDKARPEVIDINDDESPKQPDKKLVKKEVEKPPGPSPEVLELQKKVEKLEKDFQGACRIAGEAQARVNFLENLLDKKHEETGAADKKRVHELLEKLNEKSTLLEESSKNAAAKEEKLQEKVSRLTQQLEAEKSRASEDRKRINSRQELLTQQLKEELEKTKDRMAEESSKLKKERKETARNEDQLQKKIDSDRRRYKEKLAEASEKFEMTKKEADEKEEKLQDRINDLTKELEAEKSRANEESKICRERLAEASDKLEKAIKDDIEHKSNSLELHFKIDHLKKQLDAEKSRADKLSEESKKDKEKIEDFSKELETEKSLASEDRRRCRDRLADAAYKLEKTKKEADREEEKLNNIIDDLTEQLEAEKSRANEESKKDKEIIEEMTAKLKNSSARASKLRTRVDTLDLKLQSARKLAHEADSRAEAAENALDAAQNVNKKNEETQKDELKREINTLKAWNADAQRAIELSKADAATLQERVKLLTFQLEAEQRRSTEKQAEIDRQTYFQQQPPVGQIEIASIPIPTVSMPLKVHDIAHPTNIFQLCHAGKLDSISFDRVAVQLCAKYEECGEEGYRKYCAEKEELSLECESCGVTAIERAQVLSHLLSEEHCQKIGEKAAVSIVAYAFWFGELQKAGASARAAQIELSSSSSDSDAESAPDVPITTPTTEVSPKAPRSTPPEDPAKSKAPGVETTPKLFGPYLYTPSPIKGKKSTVRESKNEVKAEDIIVID